MADAPNLYSGATDAELDALYKQLSSGVTQEELEQGGISTPNNGKFKLGTGWKGSARDIGQHVSLVGAYKAGQKKKAYLNRNRAAAKAQQEATNQYMADRQARMDQIRQELQGRQLKAKVNAYFNSDSMQGLYDTLQNRHLENSLQQITQQYDNQLRGQSFQTAGQGLVGSSVDAQRRGDTAQQQNTAAIQAQGEAQQFAQGVKNQNEQQRQNLLSTVQSGNPADAAAYSQQLQGISNQTAAMGQQYANQTAQNQINQQGNNMQSQALGGLLSAYGNLYSAGQQGAAYGGTGRAF